MAKILRSFFSVAVIAALASLAPTLTAAADDVVLDDTATAKILITQADTRYIVKADIYLDGTTLISRFGNIFSTFCADLP